MAAKGKRFKKTIPGKLWSGPNTFSTLTDDERTKLTGLLTRLVATNVHDGSSPTSDLA